MYSYNAPFDSNILILEFSLIKELHPAINMPPSPSQEHVLQQYYTNVRRQHPLPQGWRVKAIAARLRLEHLTHHRDLLTILPIRLGPLTTYQKHCAMQFYGNEAANKERISASHVFIYVSDRELRAAIYLSLSDCLPLLGEKKLLNARWCFWYAVTSAVGD